MPDGISIGTFSYLVNVGPDRDETSFGHGVFGIYHKIHNYLLKLIRIAFNGRKAIVQINL